MFEPLDHQSKQQDATRPVIQEIMALLSQVARKLEPENTETRQWMIQHCHDPVIVELLQEMTLMTGRVVDAIGQMEPVNGITISKQFRIPKGSVSKITRRLLSNKLIQKESLPHNKKEVLFRLTPLGRELFDVHRAFDRQMERGFIQFLQRYEADELRFVVQILQDILETSFLNVDVSTEDGHDHLSLR
jgi:DNA-binding MarR family transcriptional regulator